MGSRSSASRFRSRLLVLATLAVSVFAGVFVFGAYLALLTRLGFENTQAFTALDHPGYKHFVRLRVRADGSGIDGFCVGLSDPLGPDAAPVLVNTFTWRPQRRTARSDVKCAKRPRRRSRARGRA